MLPWKLRKCHILPVSQNLSAVYFSLAKFQLVTCNLCLAMINFGKWHNYYAHKLPKLCSAILNIPKQYHRFTRFDPKTRSYLSHKSILRGLTVCQTLNHMTTTFSAECSCIPCHFLVFKRNEFEPFLILKWLYVKMSLQQTKFAVISARFA